MTYAESLFRALSSLGYECNLTDEDNNHIYFSYGKKGLRIHEETIKYLDPDFQKTAKCFDREWKSCMRQSERGL